MKNKNISKDTGNNLRESSKKAKWNKFKDKSMDGIIKGGSALGNNRFMVAIRDSFMVPFALVTGASIPMVFASLFFAGDSLISAIPGVADSVGMYWVDRLIGQPFNDCFWRIMDGFSLYVAFSLGFFIAKSYGKDGVIAGALGVAIFFLLQPLGTLSGMQTQYEMIKGKWVQMGDAEAVDIGTNYLGNNGLIVALLAVMLGVYIWCKLDDVKWLTPKMPDSVPPMVAKSFAAIFTSAIVLLIFSFMNMIWALIATEASVTVLTSTVEDIDGAFIRTDTVKTLSTIFVALESILAEPLSKMSTNIGSTILICFLIAFFWFFGIHGSNILMPVTTILWDLPSLQNMAYWAIYKKANSNGGSGEGVVKWTGSYWDTVINVQGIEMTGLFKIPMTELAYVGGTGATLPLIIAMLIFSKNKAHRELSKLAIGPGIFGINEPVNFGLPIILNPILFVPYVLGFTVLGGLSHMYVLLEWMRPMVWKGPTLPWILSTLMYTDFDWWSILFSVINLAIAFVMWLPFVWWLPKYEEKVAIKVAEKKEAERAKKLAAKKEQEKQEIKKTVE